MNGDIYTNLKFKSDIKRGCSEFYNLFPNYKITDQSSKDYMNYNKNWDHIEKSIKEKKLLSVLTVWVSWFT